MVSLALTLVGCTSDGDATPSSTTPPVAAPSTPVISLPGTGASPTPSASRTDVGPGSPATPRLTLPAAPQDTRSGSGLDVPFTVEGVVIVSKDHRVSARYVPDWAGRPNGLHPDATAAFKAMAKDAHADGRTLSIRSGYRDYATQKASFARAMQTYDEATARRYFAEPGASEHQTGLSLDAWDGVHRGSAFTATPEATWLAAHAWEYGFIVRYPEGKTDVTGYAYESWHLRFVGTDIAAEFGPNSSLTLEEYLGLA